MSSDSIQFSRREVLKMMAVTAGTLAVPRWVFAADGSAASRDRVISIFLYGGADGLTVVPPLGDPAYFDMRPTIAVAESAALPLDGFFGLHPVATGLKALYDEGSLAIVHAAGLANAQHSHFSAQAAMQQGINPGDASVGTGWLGRYLVGMVHPDPLAAVAIGTSVPRSMGGAGYALAVKDVDGFELRFDASARATLADVYANHALLAPTAQSVFEAVDVMDRVADIPPGAGYPDGELGHALSETARIIKSEAGLIVAGVSLGGWDHHDALTQRMPGVLGELSAALLAFREDIGSDEWANTTVVVQTEFGRTARENASGGADHGHGGVMLAAGGGVNGGKVYGSWPGVAPADLDEGMAVTTDYRQVLAEMMATRLGAPPADTILPGFTPQPWQGIFSARTPAM